MNWFKISRLSEDQTNKIIELTILEGLSSKQIADLLNISKSSVNNVLAKNNLNRQGGGRKRTFNPTDQEMEKLLKLMCDTDEGYGISINQVAKMYGVSVKTIKRRINEFKQREQDLLIRESL